MIRLGFRLLSTRCGRQVHLAYAPFLGPTCFCQSRTSSSSRRNARPISLVNATQDAVRPEWRCPHRLSGRRSGAPLISYTFRAGSRTSNFPGNCQNSHSGSSALRRSPVSSFSTNAALECRTACPTIACRRWKSEWTMCARSWTRSVRSGLRFSGPRREET